MLLWRIIAVILGLLVNAGIFEVEVYAQPRPRGALGSLFARHARVQGQHCAVHSSPIALPFLPSDCTPGCILCDRRIRPDPTENLRQMMSMYC